MDKYYYFVSQLPFLKFNEKVEFDKTSFLKEAAKWLSGKALRSLSEVNINNFYYNSSDCAVICNYKNFEEKLRKNLVSVRESSGAISGYQLPEDIKQALSATSPLDIEEKLLLLRWKFIDEQEQGHFFDLDFLKLYFLKLQILERLFKFNKKEGITIFDTLCEVS